MDLPRGVQRVVSRCREYFYFQAGRGTENKGPRVALPRDPQSPEFWIALREAQGLTLGPVIRTLGVIIDEYEMSPQFDRLSEGTRDQYRRGLRLARKAWGELPAEGIRPVHVRAIMDDLAGTPGKANTFLGTIRALSSWGRARDYFPASLAEGVKPYPKQGGHRPWTPEQITAAHAHLTGMVRRGVMLALYTGQRGSDVVRLGWTDIEEGGFGLRQKKTGREVWCPIVPELAAEMATWERRPGPFLLQDSGRPYTRKRLDIHFSEQRERIPELAGVQLHGLRCTAVVRLRRAGLSNGQIGDIVGMSERMIGHYCRFADKRASGEAALVHLLHSERLRNV